MPKISELLLQLQSFNTCTSKILSYRDHIDSSTCKKHVASNLLEQNQIIPFNTWVCLRHDSNTARNKKKGWKSAEEQECDTIQHVQEQV